MGFSSDQQNTVEPNSRPDVPGRIPSGTIEVAALSELTVGLGFARRRRGQARASARRKGAIAALGHRRSPPTQHALYVYSVLGCETARTNHRSPQGRSRAASTSAADFHPGSMAQESPQSPDAEHATNAGIQEPSPSFTSALSVNINPLESGSARVSRGITARRSASRTAMKHLPPTRRRLLWRRRVPLPTAGRRGRDSAPPGSEFSSRFGCANRRGADWARRPSGCGMAAPVVAEAR